MRGNILSRDCCFLITHYPLPITEFIMATDPARLFFAAWPAPEVQRALGEIADLALRECGGRAVPAHNIHLTLVFLGDQPRERVAALGTLVATISAPRFAMSVERLGYWRHNRILWAVLEESPPALQMLVDQLRQALAVAGFRIDQRPYVPHVTLLRNASRAPADSRFPAVSWPVSEYALVESVQRGRGRAYEVLRSWPLAG